MKKGIKDFAVSLGVETNGELIVISSGDETLTLNQDEAALLLAWLKKALS